MLFHLRAKSHMLLDLLDVLQIIESFWRHSLVHFILRQHNYLRTYQEGQCHEPILQLIICFVIVFFQVEAFQSHGNSEYTPLSGEDGIGPHPETLF